MKKLALISSFVMSSTLMAAPNLPLDGELGTIETKEISYDEYKSLNNRNLPDNNGIVPNFKNDGFNGPVPNNDGKLETTGKVIQTARDLVALGEAIYELVKKGKPTNVTEYAPISVIPKDPITKEHVDPFDMEGFSIPVAKNYTARITNGFGKEVVTFTYQVIYSYGGSYDGAGKYLTGVSIIPGSVKTSYGWDFNATMKLSGIMNHGSRAEPVAGVMLTVKYQMNSRSNAFERNDTIHITGAGQLQSYMVK